MSLMPQIGDTVRILRSNYSEIVGWTVMVSQTGTYQGVDWISFLSDAVGSWLYRGMMIPVDNVEVVVGKDGNRTMWAGTR